MKLNTEKLHIALGQAIEDLIAAHADPRYKINMHAWHVPHGDVCHVCLAGCTLYREGLKPREEFVFGLHSKELSNMICAIDFLRRGMVTAAYDKISNGKPQDCFFPGRISQVIPAFDEARFDDYVKALRNLQQDLAKADI